MRIIPFLVCALLIVNNISGQRKLFDVEHDKMRIKKLKNGDYNLLITSAYVTDRSVKYFVDSYESMKKNRNLNELCKVSIELYNDSTISIVTDDIEKFKKLYGTMRAPGFCVWDELALSRKKSKSYDPNLYNCVFTVTPPSSFFEILSYDDPNKLLFESSPRMIIDNIENKIYKCSLSYTNSEFVFEIIDTTIVHNTDEYHAMDRPKNKTSISNIRYSTNNKGIVKKNKRNEYCACSTNYSIKIFIGDHWIWERNEKLGNAKIIVKDFDNDGIDELILLPGLAHGPHPIKVYKSKYSVGL